MCFCSNLKHSPEMVIGWVGGMRNRYAPGVGDGRLQWPIGEDHLK